MSTKSRNLKVANRNVRDGDGPLQLDALLFRQSCDCACCPPLFCLAAPTHPVPASDPKLVENTRSTALAASDLVLDAIFGFPRVPFDVVLLLIARAGLPIVSVDISSS
jgi:hypothetical protein